ncbi:LysR substrate-binding domain-containing protein [Achromobacter sp. ACRQX]|uniref:LysR substrate-binding domain-containing protein n=1 Tax=Achromobacter sp. ACRQX TaxID=2918181 RepID=UPI001EF241CD|nr:LysR substrate-binding domain-containing protein [Achromobacter sp. ACRQX]MCG7328282.1 LysR substrate-binding domain-containing protein [Achromobacter sp. ACRQX]
MPASPRIPDLRHISGRLRLRHLDLLHALHAQGSVHKAAARLGMTQPAASKLLLELEDMFGVPLFVRSRRGIAPTAFGQALAGKTDVLLADLAGARNEIAALAAGARGRIRVGVQPVALPVLVPRAIQRLREHHPGVTVMLHEGAHDALLDSLTRGELDCVLGRLMLDAAQAVFRTEVLYEEPICVVARKGHPLARSTRITASTLARQDWILPPPDAPLRQRIDAYFAQHGMALPAPVAESVSLLANEVLLRGADMLAAMPRAVAHHYADLGVLAILKFKPDWSLPAVGVVQRAHVEPTAALTHFLDALRHEAGALQDAPATRD